MARKLIAAMILAASAMLAPTGAQAYRYGTLISPPRRKQ